VSLPPIPTPPDWTINWPAIDFHPWMQELKGCPQNPERHAEGDVWIHVHMVVEAMAALPAWQELPEESRRILFHAALFHDVAKPACTRIESDGHISARGHSWRGAVRTRTILWQLGIPFVEREAICSIIRHHLLPFFLADSEDPRRLAIEASHITRCDWLCLMSEADARGRISADPDRLLHQIARFRQIVEELNCLDQPHPFRDEGERLRFFYPERKMDQSGSEMILLCGLPGAGKDHWVQEHYPDLPMIALDDLKHDLHVPPHDPKGEAMTRARELARSYLAQKQPFIWNATNLSRHGRADCVKLAHIHGASVRMVYVEVPPERLYAQNRSRKRRVPEKAIERMLDRWEVPSAIEAEKVEYVVAEENQ
jgi:predicted kinase